MSRFFSCLSIAICLSIATYAQDSELETAAAMLDSAAACKEATHYAEGLEFAKKATAIYRSEYGMVDSLTANGYEMQGRILRDDGKNHEVLELFDTVLMIRKEIFDEKSKPIASIYYRMAVVHYMLNDLQKSTQFVEKAYHIQQSILPPEHEDIMKTRFLIGSIAYWKEEYNEAYDEVSDLLRIGLKSHKANDVSLVSYYQLLGGVCLKKSEYQLAVQYFSKAVDINLNKYGSDHPSTGLAYGNLGLAHSYLGNHDTTLYYYEKNLEIQKNKLRPKHPRIAYSHNKIGNNYKMKSKYQESIFHYKQAAKIWEANYGKNSLYVSWAYLGLGGSYVHTADQITAREYFNKAINIMKVQYPQPLTEMAGAYMGIGLVHQNLYEHAIALEYFNKAEEAYKKLSSWTSVDMSILLTNMGNSYRILGDYDKAEEAYNQSLLLKKKLYKNPMHSEMATTYQSMGSFYTNTADWDKAAYFLHKALEINIANEGKTSIRNAACYQGLGFIYRERGQLDSALHFYQKALFINKNYWKKDHQDIALALRKTAYLHQRLGDYNIAEEYNLKALQMYERLDGSNSHSVAISHFHIGSFYAYTERLDEAIPHFKKAISLKKLYFDTYNYNMIDQYLALAEVYDRQERYKLAESYYDTTEVCLSQIRKQVSSPMNRKAIFGTIKWHFERMITYHLDNPESEFYAPELAFLYAEKAKGNQLLSAFYDSRAKSVAGIPEDILDKEMELELQLTQYDKHAGQLLSQGLEQTDTAVLANAKLRSAVLEQKRALVEDLERDYPNYYSLKYDLHISDVTDVQQMLPDDTSTVLSYFTGDSVIVIFVIRKDTFVARQLRHDFPLCDWVTNLTKYGIARAKNRTRYEDRKYTQAALQLYEKLISPVESLLTHKLIIIPDATLGYVPFEALLTDKPKREGNYATYPFMIYNYQISYAYSATLLHEMQEKTHSAKPTKSILAMAPFYDGDIPALMSLVDTSALFATRSALEPLVASGEEVATVSKLHNGDAFYGVDASIDKFQEVASSYRILHLSTHAKANDRLGGYSYLAFGLPNDSKHFDKLYGRDLYNYQLNADMVVLSACETGIGKIQKSEGIISLARAFAYAGAKSIFTTLWSVSDESTKDIMISFHKNITLGYSKDEALRGAKLNYLKKNKRNMNPYFWAGIIGIGDMRPMKK